MKQTTKIVFALVLLVIAQLHFSECEGRHLRHNRHSHHQQQHPHRTEEEEENLNSENEEDMVVAYLPRRNRIKDAEDEDSDDNNSASNTVENRINALERYVSYLCLEDEEDIERRIRHLGVQCKCPMIKAPVCGSDGVTYLNRCFLLCRAQQAAEAYHRYRITLRKYEPC